MEKRKVRSEVVHEDEVEEEEEVEQVQWKPKDPHGL